MKSTERIFLFIFSELVFLWLSASLSVVCQRVKIDRVLGTEGGQFQHGGFVAQIRGALKITFLGIYFCNKNKLLFHRLITV